MGSDQIISGIPDVTTAQHQLDDEFIIIACDGVWDAISNQEAVDFIRGRLKHYTKPAQPNTNTNLKLSAIVEELLDHCISSCDNLTAILVYFANHSVSPAMPQVRTIQATQHIYHQTPVIHYTG